MSLLSKLLGSQRGTLPNALALDLVRLRKAARALGEVGLMSRLKLTDEEQLHEINHRLGKRLESCSPADRVAVANVFANADGLLPPEVRTVATSAQTSEIRSVQDTGCADLGRTLDATQISDIHAHLQ